MNNNLYFRLYVTITLYIIIYIIVALIYFTNFHVMAQNINSNNNVFIRADETLYLPNQNKAIFSKNVYLETQKLRLFTSIINISLDNKNNIIDIISKHETKALINDIIIKANMAKYETQNNTISFHGNVQIVNKNIFLIADHAVYNLNDLSFKTFNDSGKQVNAYIINK